MATAFKSIVRWLWPPEGATALPATTWVSSDSSVVTAELGGEAADATFDVVVTGLANSNYQATYSTVPAPGTAVRMNVGRPGGGASVQVDSKVGPDLSSTAAALNDAARAAGPDLFAVVVNGNSLEITSLSPGIDGAFQLEAPPGTAVRPDAERTPGAAAFSVNGAASALAPGTPNKTSAAPGVTLVAHASGRAEVVVGKGAPAVRMPGAVLVTAIVWLVALGVVGLQYPDIAVRWFGAKHYLLQYHVHPNYGPIPGSVPWFAAVGGILISLDGIFTHNRAWDRSYDYWHYLRPVVSALVGTVAALLVLVLISAANASSGSSLTQAAASSQSTRVLLDAVAVLVGYREAAFRALIAKVLDAVIGPGGSSGGSSSASSPKTSS